MKISTKGRYALRMVIDIAEHAEEGPVALRESAQRTGISVKYMEQLAGQLTRYGVLRSTRGAHGGYSLSRPATDITAGDILRASEGSMATVACLEEGAGICPMRGECETVDFWTGLDRTIESYVDSVSVDDMVRKRVRVPQVG